jgi:DNA-binding protein HU-beta
VTKAELISIIAEKTGINKEDVTLSLEKFFDVVKNTLEEGENIYVRGFGSFVHKQRARKIARNITKNTSIVIQSHFIPAFKPAKSFIERLKKSPKLLEIIEEQEKKKK